MNYASGARRAVSRQSIATAFALFAIGMTSACYRTVVPIDGDSAFADEAIGPDASNNGSGSRCSTLPEPPQPHVSTAAEGDPACARACQTWATQLSSEIGSISICWPALGAPCVRASSCIRTPFSMECHCGTGPMCGVGESCIYTGPLSENAVCHCDQRDGG